MPKYWHVKPILIFSWSYPLYNLILFFHQRSPLWARLTLPWLYSYAECGSDCCFISSLMRKLYDFFLLNRYLFQALISLLLITLIGKMFTDSSDIINIALIYILPVVLIAMHGDMRSTLFIASHSVIFLVMQHSVLLLALLQVLWSILVLMSYSPQQESMAMPIQRF